MTLSTFAVIVMTANVTVLMQLILRPASAIISAVLIALLSIGAMITLLIEWGIQ